MTLKYTEEVKKEVEVELPFAATDGHDTVIATEEEFLSFNKDIIVRFQKGTDVFDRNIAKAHQKMLRIEMASAYQRLDEVIESFRQTA